MRPSREALVIAWAGAAFSGVSVIMGVAFLLLGGPGAPGGLLMIVGGAGYAVMAVRSLRCRVECREDGLTIANVWRTYRVRIADVNRVAMCEVFGDISGGGFFYHMRLGTQLYSLAFQVGDAWIYASATRRRRLGELRDDWVAFVSMAEDACGPTVRQILIAAGL